MLQEDVCVESISGSSPCKTRLFRSSVDQLQQLALNQQIDGVILGLWHATLGWRPTVLIVFGDDFSHESANAFMLGSKMTKVGMFSCSASPEPSEAALGELHKIAAASECKNPILVHFIQDKFQVNHRAFEVNMDTKATTELLWTTSPGVHMARTSRSWELERRPQKHHLQGKKPTTFASVYFLFQLQCSWLNK